MAKAKGEQMDKKNTVQNIRLPSLYKELRNLVLEDLHQLMGGMFGQADDVFFESAEKAGNNQEQEAHLAAMREVRLLRKSIERKLYKNVANLFKEFPDPSSSLNKPVIEAISSADELSIMQVDEVEENVAIESMVSRMSNDNNQGLEHFSQRLDVLAMNVEVSSTNIPLSPRHVCEAFRGAIDELAFEIKYKLIVYKLFERHVLNKFNQVLEHANQLMASAGVLADQQALQQHNKPAVQNPAVSPPALQPSALAQGMEQKVPAQTQSVDQHSVNQQQVAHGQVDQANVMVGQLHDLMSSIRGSSFSVGSTQFSNPVIGSMLPTANAIGMQDLVSVLSGIQQAQPSLASAVAAGSVSSLALTDLLSNEINNRVEGQGPEKVSDVDSDVINLVSMLFDFILDDKSLPTPVKVLIGRLQIPMIKVAMLDQAFFARGSHPARRLLNNLARAGIGLSGIKVRLAKDPVYEKIQLTVQTILDEFSDNLALFEKLDREFTEFVDIEERRSVLIEQRTRTAEEGRAKSDIAKCDTEKAIKDCIGETVVPEAVTKILSDPWSKVLYLSHLKEGGDSRDFQKKVMVARHLIKSVTSPGNKNERKFLYDMIPTLLKRLQEGFDSISYNPFDANEMLTALEAAQMEVLREKTAESLEREETGSSEAVDSLLEAISNDINQLGVVSKRDINPTSNDSALDVKANSIGAQQSKKTSRVTSLDITKISSNSTASITLDELEEDDSDYLKAKAMAVGSWVNINETPEKGPESAVRCKLAAYIKSADRMIFVNRSGIKVAEHSMLGLAHAFKQKSIAVIDDALLFDKALENVIGSLRKVRHSSL